MPPSTPMKAGAAAIGLLALGALYAMQQPAQPTAQSEVQPAEAAAVADSAQAEAPVLEEAAPERLDLSASTVEELITLTGEGTPFEAGQAIVELRNRRSLEAKDALEAIRDDRHNTKLVRTWAVGARIQMIESRLELFEGTGVGTLPEAREPLQDKAKELYADEDDPAPLLRAMTYNPALVTPLAPLLVQTKPRELVRLMFTSDDDTQRRSAASYVGAMVKEQGYDAVSAQVVRQLAYESEASEVPWSGGSLFLPALSWKGAEATPILESLASWRSWCQQRQDTGCTRQIDNNTRSVGLQWAARGR